MGYPTTDDGTQIVATPEWKLGQLALSNINDGKVAMNVDPTPTTPLIVWNGTGGSDTGGDWTRTGEGSETNAAAKSGTNGLDTTKTDENDVSVFDNGSMIDVGGTYAVLEFWIRAKSYPIGSNPKVLWRDSSNALVGQKLRVARYIDDFTDDTEWHHVSIPITDFVLDGNNVQKLVFRFEDVGDQRYFIDDITLYEDGGPQVFQAKAPSGVVYHLKDMILTFVEENGTWEADDFTGIVDGLEKGLLMRNRKLSTGEVHWSINFKRNLNLFGRLNVLNDVEYSSAVHQLTLALDPWPAVVKVTNDDVVEFVVRDDLSSINAMRSYIRYGEE